MKQKLLRKLRSKSFWVQLIGAVVLLLGLCGVKIDAPYAGEITEALCSLLIILGLITAPAPAAKECAEGIGGEADDKEGVSPAGLSAGKPKVNSEDEKGCGETAPAATVGKEDGQD